MINNESIIENLSKKIWDQIKDYVLKGYVDKKVYIKPKNKSLFNNNFLKLESWEILSQRNDEIVCYINNEILSDSGLQLKCIDLGWEIFNKNKIFYTFTFKIKIVPIIKISEVSTPQIPATTNLTEKASSISSNDKNIDDKKRHQSSSSSSSSRFVVSQKDK